MSEAARRSLLSEALIIAGVPALGYATAFLYEAGYLSHFGLPLWAIQLDLSKVFIAAGALLVLVWFVYMVAALIPLKFFVVLQWVRVILIPGLIAFGAWEAIVIARSSDRPLWWWVLAGFMVLMTIWSLYLWIIEPIRSRPGLPSWTDRLREEWQKEAREWPETLFSIGVRSLWESGYNARRAVLTGFGVVILAQAAFWAGRHEARIQETYLVDWDDSTLVALREYEDLLLVGELSPSSGTPRVLVGYRFQSIGQNEPTRWRRMRLGEIIPAPLTVAHRSGETRWK